MKKILLIVLLLFVGCSKEPIKNMDDLTNERLRAGIGRSFTNIPGRHTWYTKDTNIPYSGKAVQLWENGKKDLEGTFKGGKSYGKWTWWYENGQKNKKGTYKYGEKDGKWTEWHENGQKEKEGNYKNGKPHGKLTKWWYNGKKQL